MSRHNLSESPAQPGAASLPIAPNSSGYVDWRIGVGILFLALLVVLVRSPYAFLTVITEGMWAVWVLLPAAALGYAVLPMPLFWRVPFRWYLLVAGTFGIGLTCIFIMLLGSFGVMGQTTWMLIQAACVILGFTNLVPHIKRALTERMIRKAAASTRTTQGVSDAVSPNGGKCCWPYALLTLAPFLALAMLAASSAPGFLWREEAGGYDVLEYHLQLPKEYIQQGSITFMPHNVYANFPANVEMLYMLSMMLSGRTIEAGVSAQMIHLAFAALCVWGGYVVGRDYGIRSGVVGSLVLGSVGWFVYLSALAYVENGMLLFGFVSAGMLVRFAAAQQDAQRTDNDSSGQEVGLLNGSLPPHALWLFIAGMLAGFACGCKYTAVLMIALPLLLVVPILANGSFNRRMRLVVMFGLGVLVAFAPWLIKNGKATRNPVFPLANSVFRAHPPGWERAQSEQWRAGHAAVEKEASLAARFTQAGRRIVLDPNHRFGPLLLGLGLLGLIGRRTTKVDLALLIMLVTQFAIWLFATHLFARFAVVLLVPLGLLAMRSFSGSGVRGSIIVIGLVAGIGFNLYHAAAMHATEWIDGVDASFIKDGEIPGYDFYGVVNNELSEDAQILLVGEAKAFYFEKPVDYHVVFNKQPLEEVIESAEGPQEVVGWLVGKGYTHVLVNWAEVHRLSRTYGFPESINPAMFDQLSQAGLKPIRVFQIESHSVPYAVLYEVDPL